MEQERLLEGRREICRICAMLSEKNLVSGKDGNISVRAGEDEMLLTPSGVFVPQRRRDCTPAFMRDGPE